MALSSLDQVVKPQNSEMLFLMVLSSLDQVVRLQELSLTLVLQLEVSLVVVLQLEEVQELQAAFKLINLVTSSALVLVLPTLAALLINSATQSTPALLLLFLAPLHSADQPPLVEALVVLGLVNTTHMDGLKQNGDTRLQTHLMMNTSTLLPIT